MILTFIVNDIINNIPWSVFSSGTEDIAKYSEKKNNEMLIDYQISLTMFLSL